MVGLDGSVETEPTLYLRLHRSGFEYLAEIAEVQVEIEETVFQTMVWETAIAGFPLHRVVRVATR